MVTKEKYISLIETALSAYTDEHIINYFNDVKTNGLTEHGFPRLTVCIGIMIAHKRREYLFPLFCEMMEFCCKTIPTVKAANEFSVREIILCFDELQRHGVVDRETLDRWRGYIATIEPHSCYKVYAKEPTDKVFNWALFSATSEQMRKYAGLADTSEFIDLQIETQLKWLDENLMYRDDYVHPPMVYDLVSRSLFSMILFYGYKGKHYEKIDECLRRAGLLTLKMQSTCGELGFGGRSNQFLLNEGLLTIIYEFEANRYAKLGDMETAARFKRGVEEAIAATDHWFSKKPIYHTKNRFSPDTRFGCEDYGYFDKYMITTASWFYAACLMCNEEIQSAEICDETEIFLTSDHFHKLFVKRNNYSLQFDLNAHRCYDASGLGRVHRRGAPTALCLSVPCPSASRSKYYIGDSDTPCASLCPGYFNGESYVFGTESVYTLTDQQSDEESASVSLDCIVDSVSLSSTYTLTDDGVSIDAEGEGEIAFMLPIFDFDGEERSQIDVSEKQISVTYNGWICRYKTDRSILDLGETAHNRNGHYKLYCAKGNQKISLKIEIFKA